MHAVPQNQKPPTVESGLTLDIYRLQGEFCLIGTILHYVFTFAHAHGMTVYVCMLSPAICVCVCVCVCARARAR